MQSCVAPAMASEAPGEWTHCANDGRCLQEHRHCLWSQGVFPWASWGNRSQGFKCKSIDVSHNWLLSKDFLEILSNPSFSDDKADTERGEAPCPVTHWLVAGLEPDKPDKWCFRKGKCWYVASSQTSGIALLCEIVTYFNIILVTLFLVGCGLIPPNYTEIIHLDSYGQTLLVACPVVPCLSSLPSSKDPYPLWESWPLPGLWGPRPGGLGHSRVYGSVPWGMKGKQLWVEAVSWEDSPC